MRKLLAAALAIPAVALLGSGAEPAADEPRGRLVLGLHPPERVAVLDVESGELEERRLPGGTLCHGPLMVSGDRIDFGGSRRGRPALMSLDLGLEKPARVLAWRAQQYLPGSREGVFWVLRTRYRGAAVRTTGLREVSADGRVLFRPQRRPPAGYPMAAANDGIVFEHRGRARIWNPRTGALRSAPGLWMVAASGDRSAWCSGRCRRLRLEGPGDGLSAPAPARWSFHNTGSLSPDGSLLAVSAFRDGRPLRSRVALVDTADGATRLLPRPVPAVRGEVDWAPSGEWLYVAAAGRRIAAYRPADGRVVTLPIRLADDVIDLAAAG